MIRPPTCWHACLLALASLVASAPALAASTLSLGHFAPGEAEVRFTSDRGAPSASLQYAGFAAMLDVPAGTHRLRALRADGSVIAELELELRDGDSKTVFLAGAAATPRTPALLAFDDHNHPFVTRGETPAPASMQTLMLDPTRPMLMFRNGCAANQARVLTYGAGHAGPGFVRSGQSCELSITESTNAPALDTLVLVPEPGQRLWVVLAGDDVHQPQRIHVLEQRREPSVPLIEATDDIEGMYVSPSLPGYLFLVSHAPARPDPVRVAVLGTDEEGRSTWALVADGRLHDIRGGSAGGDGGTLAFVGGFARVDVHSCSELTLHAFWLNDSGPVFSRPPRDAFRLHKMLPQDNCGARK